MHRLVLALCLLPALAVAAKPPKVSLDPNEISASKALGDDKCTQATVAGPNSPFVVDWPDMHRADLETGMDGGVVVVQYGCDGFRVLPTCKLPGTYAYTGISPKSNVVEMKDGASVQANFGSFVSPVKFQTAFEQGRSLNLAYMMVGTRTTTVSQVRRADLVGSCEGATHFVNRAYLGAFAMESATAGSARAAIDVMSYGGAGAGAEASRQSLQRDGQLDACQAAGTTDAAPRAGCAAMLRVMLLPIDGASQGAAGTVDARGCPEGFVFSDGACARKSEVSSWLCDPGDLVGCKAQCAAGSSESCGRYAGILLDTYLDDLVIPADRSADLVRDLNASKDAFVTACTDKGEADACSMAGMAQVTSEALLRPTDGLSWVLAGDYFEAACAGGEAMACDVVNDTYTYGMLEDDELSPIARDIPKVNALLSQACEVGSARACLMLAENHAFDFQFRDAFSAAERAHTSARAVSDACHAGLTEACVIAAAAYLPKDRCQDAVDWISKRVSEDSKLYMFEDDDVFCPLTEKLVEPAKSVELAAFACAKGDEL
ncbi:MAG: hypothetical protein KC621_04315, partial [Myxococcales bacterium]|nr:hypothetical protein [Myxococcales bacterium]